MVSDEINPALRPDGRTLPAGAGARRDACLFARNRFARRAIEWKVEIGPQLYGVNPAWLKPKIDSH